jgi:uroporphyrinogen-III synthase
MNDLPLRGKRVVTTRDERGEVERLLEMAGATVVHMPLIQIVDAADGGVDLQDHLRRIAEFDWLVVTSRHGASRVGKAVRSLPVRLAAVGTKTAAELAALARRPVDVVPELQTGAGLLAAMAPEGAGQRVLLPQADRAGTELAEGLRERGYDVTTVIAYRTALRRPTARELRAALTADAVAFASGSAVQSWVDAIGFRTPRVVVAIGPTTASFATKLGLRISHVSADPSVPGLVREIVHALAPPEP